MKLYYLTPIVLFSAVTVHQAETEPCEKERKSVVVPTTVSAINKLISITAYNEIHPSDVIIYIYAMGFYKAQHRGYFTIYLIPEKKQVVVTGNNVFINNTKQLMTVLENNEDLDYKLFDFKNTKKVRELDEKLWSLGIKVNVDR